MPEFRCQEVNTDQHPRHGTVAWAIPTLDFKLINLWAHVENKIL